MKDLHQWFSLEKGQEDQGLSDLDAKISAIPGLT
jgi:hypothetical protein